MARTGGEWVRVKKLTAEDRAMVSTACDRFIAEILKPRFLPEPRPTAFNYPVDIFGRWRGASYSIVTRYRSGFSDNLGEEFDAAFTRLDHVEEHVGGLRFNVMWHRHTGRWYRLHASVPLDEALRLIESEELLWPL